MLQTQLATPGRLLRPYVWCYGQSTGHIVGDRLHVPLPARPKQVLMFFFRDRFTARVCDSDRLILTPRAVVVGPQTHHRVDLSVSGAIDSFTIHFQPAGFHHLFGIPMSELTNATYDAHAVLEHGVGDLEDELAGAPSFEARIEIAERYLLRELDGLGPLGAIGKAANRLFACDGAIQVADLAAYAEVTPRHLERRFLTQVGVSPKLYARMVRFNAALDGKLCEPGRTWTDMAHELGYHDQMHMVHDFHGLAGVSPTCLLAQLEAVPQFHTAFATAARPYR